MLASLLSIRATREVKTTSYFQGIISFGFKENATYSVNVSTNATKLIVGWMSKSEWKNATAMRINTSANNFVENYNLSKIYQIQSFDNTNPYLLLAGNISVKDAYYLYVFAFDDKYNFVKIEYNLTNPNGLLDFRYENLLITAPVMAAISGILLAFWLINWLRNFNVQIYIHYVFTAVFILTFANNVAYVISVARNNVSETNIFPFIILFFSHAFKEIIFSFAIVLAASGWCILVDSIKIYELIICIVLSSAYIGAKLVQEYCNFEGVARIITDVIFFISLSAYSIKLIIYTQQASLMIWAHMIAIRNAGIDPTTTPVQKKHAMYISFEIALIVYTISILVKFCVVEFGPVGWLNTFVDQALDQVISFMLAWIFRIRDRENNGYSAIEESMEHVDDMQLSEIEAATNNEADLHNGIEWRPGMQLPGRPNIITQPSQQQITLESPDGEQNLTATNITSENTTV
ncbi:hypothetical protein TVAG_057840 [Trichomonas vaginalis G3]|uniref:Uncharacterized protein n=1 Tax=Trichomonas vaginalis (strain ATCC PRA-98 / G3) TaxID=412133 RepID=A2FLD3_TRIV3|nr:lung seven transmembrane receptor family [Trichomonas vaginalis G3]EAX94283.1 hypothetical protein TVAG_057840 [Trichomonas vaginalis G3]KAI5524655.1 lung seven transmembrane receptor family [Trichomonas vaginalis G3]|eukprot:XP_001307213.1 hypothetical protein [Trichomonas vaginalis G3]